MAILTFFLVFDAQRKELQNNNSAIPSNPALLRANLIYIYIYIIDLLPFSACENTREDLADPTHPEKHSRMEIHEGRLHAAA